MSQRRQWFVRGAIAALLVAVGLFGLLVEPQGGPTQRPGPERARPTVRPRPTLMVATRVPAPVPIPTVSPLNIGSGMGTPAPPVLLSGPESAVVNVTCRGDCVTGGGPSWLTSDVLLKWRHPDPPGVDEYLVYRARMEPYFEPETCLRCELVGTTTGLELVVPDSPPGFNPVGGTAGMEMMTEIDFYVVRAVNAGGASGSSNRVGSQTWSLMQGASFIPDP